ncbi:hypothetical protein BHM03_00057708 [Ensete ventricosum]|nr:hypothetical protein BHM03_00057708 [Ensete ventricosum]
MHCAYRPVRVPYRYQQYVGTPVRIGLVHSGTQIVVWYTNIPLALRMWEEDESHNRRKKRRVGTRGVN